MLAKTPSPSELPGIVSTSSRGAAVRRSGASSGIGSAVSCSLAVVIPVPDPLSFRVG